ncbi:MAG: leucyl/phenylalanyl-tRNA--protein transferase [Inquilinaceae bacterium]
MQPITPDILLRAYAHGLFPMAETAESDELHWFDPPMRGVLPLDAFHLPRRLRRLVQRGPFDIRADTAFRAVVEACAEPAGDRLQTWINPRIVSLYEGLARSGHAHSVECWIDDRLVGGLYGVALGGAFFGESMFSRERDASKVALVHLVARLRRGGYVLLDTQFTTPHLASFGGIEIPQATYKARLAEALKRQAVFPKSDDGALAAFLEFLRRPGDRA